MICTKCQCNHDGTFGSGRFCSRACANSRNFTEESRNKKSKALIGKRKFPDGFNLTCDKCNNVFISTKNRVKGRKSHCDNCKRTVENKRIAARTWSKILKRINAVCTLCLWNEASLDVHHIIHRKNGGSDKDTNLIVLCPNCHRKAHCGKIQENILFSNCIAIKYPNWIDYYNTSP